MKVDKQREHEDITFQKLTTHAKIEVKKRKKEKKQVDATYTQWAHVEIKKNQNQNQNLDIEDKIHKHLHIIKNLKTYFVKLQQNNWLDPHVEKTKTKGR